MIRWGQVIPVGSVVLIFVWAATKWTALGLAFQPELGRPCFALFGWPLYAPSRDQAGSPPSSPPERAIVSCTSTAPILMATRTWKGSGLGGWGENSNGRFGAQIGGWAGSS
jgi:hypothetical protein